MPIPLTLVKVSLLSEYKIAPVFGMLSTQILGSLIIPKKCSQIYSMRLLEMGDSHNVGTLEIIMHAQRLCFYILLSLKDNMTVGGLSVFL